jgi:hypothetical protein
MIRRDFVALIIFLLIFSSCISGNGQNAFLKLVEKNYTTISVFEYKLNRKGLAKKHGTLTAHLRVDTHRRMISGYNRLEYFVKRAGASGIQYLKMRHEAYFNSRGLLLKQIDRPLDIDPDKEGKEINIDSISNLEFYEYDLNDSPVKITYQNCHKSYAISRATNDTLHNAYCDTTIDSTVYDNRGNPVRSFIQQEDDIAPRLTDEWEYNNLGLRLINNMFNKAGELFYRKHFFYDKDNRAVREIDSSEETPGKSDIKQIIDYEYRNDGWIITHHETFNDGQSSMKWDEMRNFIKSETHPSYYQIQVVNDGKKARNEITFEPGHKIQTEFRSIYDTDGFLIEQYFIFYSDPEKSKVIRYFYK